MHGQTKAKFGFGLMRLPKVDDKIDLPQVCEMVDRFLAAGFTYFDTAFVYDGSEQAAKAALVDRHPRTSYTLATKLHVGKAASAEEARRELQISLERTGAGYFDYYLLHALMDTNIEKYAEYGLWDFVKEQKARGTIRHYGFSFHDKPETLDKLLTEHPDVDFVQLQINYADWENPEVQSRACYEVARRHGKPVVIMEPVKGGALADPPAEVKALFDAAAPGVSYASWALRFAASLDGVLAVLSGMSTLGQVEENVAVMRETQPLTERELDTLAQAARLYREAGPAGTADFTPYEAVNPKGVSAADILDTYNSCILQPVPTFGAEHNYFSAEKAKYGLRKDDLCIPGKVILSDGTDRTELIHQAEAFLNEHTFFQYAF